jgi:hypothetical protein
MLHVSTAYLPGMIVQTRGRLLRQASTRVATCLKSSSRSVSCLSRGHVDDDQEHHPGNLTAQGLMKCKDKADEARWWPRQPRAGQISSKKCASDVISVRSCWPSRASMTVVVLTISMMTAKMNGLMDAGVLSNHWVVSVFASSVFRRRPRPRQFGARPQSALFGGVKGRAAARG